jgi:hypothetical protein
MNLERLLIDTAFLQDIWWSGGLIGEMIQSSAFLMLIMLFLEEIKWNRI